MLASELCFKYSGVLKFQTWHAYSSTLRIHVVYTLIRELCSTPLRLSARRKNSFFKAFNTLCLICNNQLRSDEKLRPRIFADET